MAEKLIVCDLDRTLLRNDKTISDYTIKVFEKAQQKGIKIVFATARPLRSITDYTKIIACDTVIALNGAVIKTGNDLKTYPISTNTADKLIKELLSFKENLKISAEIDNKIYANFDLSKFSDSVFLENFSELPHGELYKIIIGLDSQSVLEKVKFLVKDDVYLSIANNKLIQIMNKKASKWQAIQYIADKFKTDISDIICFGDDNDDIEMLKYCAKGIAVENAIKEVLKICSFITESNENDGVAKYIEKYVL